MAELIVCKSWGAEILKECSPPTICHMSRVICHVLHVMCHVSGVKVKTTVCVDNLFLDPDLR